MSPVRVERRGPVLLVTLDRPAARNAVDGATASALAAAWDRLRDEEALAAAVLTGAGPEAFCAGADLKALGTLRETEGGWLGITRRLDAGKPVLAAVNGTARGGGVELSLVADLRIVEEHATFALTNRRWGVPLVDGGTQRLPRVVGLGRALEMVLTGREVDAPTALAWGLANEVVPRGRSVARAVEIATAIAAFPQEALRADRAGVLAGLGRPLPEGLRSEAARGRRAIRHPEFADAGKRFAERKR